MMADKLHIKVTLLMKPRGLHINFSSIPSFPSSLLGQFLYYSNCKNIIQKTFTLLLLYHAMQLSPELSTSENIYGIEGKY